MHTHACCQVSLAGEEQATATHFETTNPQFATSVAFPKLALPTHPELSAPLNLSVYDYDKWSVPPRVVCFCVKVIVF